MCKQKEMRKPATSGINLFYIESFKVHSEYASVSLRYELSTISYERVSGLDILYGTLSFAYRYCLKHTPEIHTGNVDENRSLTFEICLTRYNLAIGQ